MEVMLNGYVNFVKKIIVPTFKDHTLLGSKWKFINPDSH